ncbi:MAG TPA: MFS transporter [Pseudonocardia sp.]|jgi:MHS family proline/betaine transporter-like MFS transporter
MSSAEQRPDQRERFSAPDQPDERVVRRAVAGAAMGNAVEWFDYAIYSYLAASIGINFFPSGNPTTTTLLTFSGIAIPFALRPLGGIVLGPLGDKFGRRRVLSLTILFMSGATFAIGLIPNHTAIGLAAPVLLVLLRLIQGFSTGGEYGGAATFIAEYAPDRRRGFYGSFLEFGTLGGYVLGAGLATLFQLSLTADALNSWGWRIPFLMAAPLGLVGFYLRTKLEDTPAFQQLSHGEPQSVPLAEMISINWRQILNLIGIVILLNVADYTVLTYMPTYLTQVLKINDAESNLALIGVMLVMMLFISPVGALSDRIGRKPVLLTAAIGFLVLSWPAVALINLKTPLPVTVGLAILGVLLLLMLGTIGSTFPAMFPTRHRYGAFSIGYSVSTAIFGGTAPIVITKLIAVTGSTTIPAYYIMGAAVVAILPIVLMPETARLSIAHATEIPGSKAEALAR